jgi:hypothetical protein
VHKNANIQNQLIAVVAGEDTSQSVAEAGNFHPVEEENCCHQAEVEGEPQESPFRVLDQEEQDLAEHPTTEARQTMPSNLELIQVVAVPNIPVQQEDTQVAVELGVVPMEQIVSVC